MAPHSSTLAWEINPMDGGAWWAGVHGVAKSWTGLSDFTFTFHFHALEKEMPTHSNTSCLENPMDGGAWCRLLSMGSQRVGHNWATSLSLSPLMALFSLPFKLENSTFSFCNGSYKLCSPVWTWPWRAMRSMRNRGKILKGSWQDHICALETCPGNRVVHGFGGPMHWRQGTQLE